MNKKEFLNALKKELKGVDKSEQDKFIMYYDELIQDMIDGGMDEIKAVEAQGDLNEIAAGILKDVKTENIDNIEKNSNRNKLVAIIAIIICIASVGVTALAINQRNKNKKKVEINVNEEKVVVSENGTEIVEEINQNYEISEELKYDESVLTEKVNLFLDKFDEADYDYINDYLADPIMSDYLNEKYMDGAKAEIAPDFGKLKERGKIYFYALNDNGKDYTICELFCIYENVSVSYRIVLNSELKVEGFFFK